MPDNVRTNRPAPRTRKESLAPDKSPGSSGAGVTGASILLEGVTKSYGGGAPAVDQLTLEIPAGQTVMFVGPSGCGKTTTLKMINRLIEPTRGRIVIDGEDVTGMNGDELRRRIGYVVQAGGLLPHMTVGANVGLVPRMLRWSRQRVAERVDELLDLVSLDPAEYRDRFPRELSGGQQQRVGVARALAADPPVLLMDEPFGAVDPITRQRLQEELVNIQNELHKTVVFVTHDFDEAVMLGDWIVIFNNGAQIMQYDTPEQILASPSNEFVEDFIGSGAGLMQLGLTRVAEVPLREAVTAHVGDDSREVERRLREAGGGRAVVLDRRDRPVGWASSRQILRAATVQVDDDQDFPAVGARSTLDDALNTMLLAGSTQAVVHGSRQRYLGVITVSTVIKAIEQASSRAPDEAAAAPLGHNSGATADGGADTADAAGTAARGGTAGTTGSPAVHTAGAVPRQPAGGAGDAPGGEGR
ncbi:ATP-binding cassette domain-containing protein [Actinomyces sp. 2119]|uniref:ATP-binding cassette domain-containing protein n=1 Tax=Actinomyces lilanjuaniae TaxID=2321394 RepID=A0ABM6Z4N6_9ACTO|nr:MULTISPECIES: betaine/proline/choline family ABC transporter ATP-binding protein [Actinomyces]AYD89895.1 ATP-binding cassette domain-containing protein [Actinomyces lilanjuaniae]RJF44885.1 ATP-binding cassette domain-containing protein [Actinomyces sp. 2119]